MKGISHFSTGVALATFFPEVVQSGAVGSLLPMLGGIGGLLPDTIDFKFARYWERYDLEIDPGPDADAGAIADALVAAMREAYQTGEDRNVIAHTIRLGPDLWREYTIRFTPEVGEVAVSIGPLVNTGQVPYAGTAPDEAQAAVRTVDFPLVHTYSERYAVNIFTGPTFRFVRQDDQLQVRFLDWHHRWSHSLVLAVGVGLALGLVVGSFAGRRAGLWGGFLTWLGFTGHVLEDQLGHMGSNLFWPFTKQRLPGVGLLHAGDVIPNFLTVWTSLALILFNLDRFSSAPLLPTIPYLSGALGLPWLVLGGKMLWNKFHAGAVRLPVELLRQAEQVAEAEPPEMA